MGGAELFSSPEVQLAAFDSKSYEIYNSVLSQGTDFCCMDTNGRWHSVDWHACHRCLKGSCKAASTDKCNGAVHSHSLETSKGGYRVHFASIQRALHNSPRVEDIAVDYLKTVTSRILKPGAPEPADTALAVKKKPKQKKTTQAGGLTAEADREGTSPVEGGC